MSDGSVWTEATVLAALRERFRDPGNGGAGRFAFVTKVRTATGFAVRGKIREIDAVRLTLWPSDGYRLDAYEVKVSRADWLRELREPSKSAEARRLCEAFWIVAPCGVVELTELPVGWGLIEVLGPGQTRQRRPARYLPNSDRGLPRTFVASLLRSAGAVPR